MKLITNLLSHSVHKKLLVPFGVLFASSIFIWFAGPLISIGQSAPLQLPEKRIYAIALLFLAWGFKNYFLKQKPTFDSETKAIDPQAAKKIETLEGRFQGAMRFLSKTFHNKHGKNIKLSGLPWFLLVGASGSGKTTLLANSNINFILKKRIKPEDVQTLSATEHCDWWVTHDNVLLDVPGSYSPTAKTSYLWKNFLTLLKKLRGRHAISGVLVTLSLSDLTNRDKQENLVLELKTRIIELRENFGKNLPFYFTITKCDLLPGFIDFFEDSGSDELGQAWGITLPSLNENQKLDSVFTDRFNVLIKRLNKQLIWRLHQERSPYTKLHIKDFPLQVERLKETLIHLLSKLTAEDQFNLQGLYLTSAIQHAANTSTTSALQLTTNQFEQALELMHKPVMPSRSYFIRQFLLHGLAHVSPSPQAKMIVKQHGIAIASCVTATIMTAAFIGYNLAHPPKTFLVGDSMAKYHIEIKQPDEFKNNV